MSNYPQSALDELYGPGCKACGYREHNIPNSTDTAHDNLCCGGAGTSPGACLSEGTDVCVTHGRYPAEMEPAREMAME